MDWAGDLRAFVEVSRNGSFSRAANLMGLTPSAVSKLISRLEHRLGVKLVQRTTRRLSLTTEGEFHLGRICAIVAELDELQADIDQSHQVPTGRLRVNTSHGFGIHQLAPALPDFISRYPQIYIELALTDRLVDLDADPWDVTIRAGRLPDTGLTAKKIADYHRVICAAPAYLEHYDTPQRPDEFLKHVCISVNSQEPQSWSFRTPEGLEEIAIVPRIVCDSTEAALKLALAGAGIVRLADIIVGAAIQRGDLLPLLLEAQCEPPLPICALYLARRQRLPKVGVFVDFLLERFGSAPWRVIF